MKEKNIDTPMLAPVKEACEVLKSGGVILYPTDTVWGLGCDATNREAVEKIFAIKKRPESKSLIILVKDLDMLARYIREIPEIAISLVEISDTPLTIIYPGAVSLAPNVISSDGTVAVRIPDHPFVSALLSRFNHPLVSTSANIAQAQPPARFAEIDPAIISSADWVANSRFEEGATGKPSSIIKLGLRGEVEIIRK
ncbi:MAG: L-threonylcarbamoyladenylate synthase [Bacteroidales bacterium]|nr:L-threonylcarbamoyladenylate synthase [Bacteroidales bacterium]MDD2426239.1 L-threonylcarbamoyladenylate synthase [Bacteroidales bacterium]MDD3990368.1 L-threonylcarbamoyladenylate synthase [Bacteroidales bacterium]MDD4639424.1 L-threonylcarbamoyladenylate synthase [Bacteroidales bacterium]